MLNLFVNTFPQNRYTNWQNITLAGLSVLTCLIIASDLSVGSGGVVFVLLIAAIGLLVTTFRVPELPFIVLYMAMPIWVFIGRFVPIGDGQSSLLTTGWAILCVLVHLFLFRKDTSYKLKLDACDIVLGAFTVWIWLSLGWSGNNTYGLDKALGFTVFSTGIYALARFGFETPRFSPKRLVYLMFTVGLTYSYIITFAAFRLGGLWSLEHNLRKAYFLRKVWGIGTPSGADALAFGLLATTVLFMLARKRHLKLLYALAFLFQLWGFSTYQQRGATIGMFVGIVFIYFVLSSREESAVSSKSNRLAIILGICLLPMLGYLLWSINPQFRGDYLAADYSYQSRFMFYQIGFAAFWESPLIGNGIGGLGTALRAGYEEFYVHNRYIEILAELGIIGLGLIIAFTFLLFRRFQIGLSKVNSPTLRIGLAIAGAVLIQRYVLSMSGADLISWRLGLWAGLAVTIYTKLLESNSESITDSSESASWDALESMDVKNSHDQYFQTF